MKLFDCLFGGFGLDSSGGSQHVNLAAGQWCVEVKDGLAFVPAVVVAEVPGQAILIVRIHALEGADGFAVLRLIGDRHEDGGHRGWDITESAGQAVQQIASRRGFVEDFAFVDLRDEMGKDRFGKERVESGEQEFRMVVRFAKSSSVGPGEQAIFGAGVHDARGIEAAQRLARGLLGTGGNEPGARSCGVYFDDGHSSPSTCCLERKKQAGLA